MNESYERVIWIRHVSRTGAENAAEPPSAEKIAELKAAASACGSDVADLKKANAEGLKSKDPVCMCVFVHAGVRLCVCVCIMYLASESYMCKCVSSVCVCVCVCVYVCMYFCV